LGGESAIMFETGTRHENYNHATAAAVTFVHMGLKNFSGGVSFENSTVLNFLSNSYCVTKYMNIL
jgi:hypothetical protein